MTSHSQNCNLLSNRPMPLNYNYMYLFSNLIESECNVQDYSKYQILHA